MIFSSSPYTFFVHLNDSVRKETLSSFCTNYILTLSTKGCNSFFNDFELKLLIFFEELYSLFFWKTAVSSVILRHLKHFVLSLFYF